MAPLPTHKTPAEQLRELGAEARRRGLTFDEWWNEALRPGQPVVMVNAAAPPAGAVLWPTTGSEICDWRETIEQMREVWRSAYERWPRGRSDEAVAALAAEYVPSDSRELQPV